MYAIIKSGGKQYKVKEGDTVKLEKLPYTEEEPVEFDRVLAVSDEDGSVEFGRPYLEDARVKAKLVENGKNKKVVVFKYKPKSRQRRKIGHRQPYSKVKIEAIEA